MGCFLLIITSCAKKEDVIATEEVFRILIPEGFPDVEYPIDNEFTESRWKLGKKLFFDKSLSRDQSISCASCHLPSMAFSDTVAFSLGVAMAQGTRNSPSLANVAYHPYFTREGGVNTLEMQVLVPIQEHVELDHNLISIAEDLANDESYILLSQAAYERDIDPYVITRAIATFERSLISGNSAFDAYYYQNKEMALNDLQKEGYELFMNSKTSCFQCHSGFNFTTYDFENNGLYTEYNDPGRYRLTNKEEDKARFKIPSLRNIELTAPYMHDGSISTLKEVVQHYNQGGKSHPNKSQYIRALNLTIQEQNSLIAFLESLTDKSFITNQNYQQK